MYDVFTVIVGMLFACSLVVILSFIARAILMMIATEEEKGKIERFPWMRWTIIGCSIVMVLAIAHAMIFSSVAPKRTTIDVYRDTIRQEQMEKRVDSLSSREVSLDGIRTTRETQEEREERTRAMLDWRNRE